MVTNINKGFLLTPKNGTIIQRSWSRTRGWAALLPTVQGSCARAPALSFQPFRTGLTSTTKMEAEANLELAVSSLEAKIRDPYKNCKSTLRALTRALVQPPDEEVHQTEIS